LGDKIDWSRPSTAENLNNVAFRRVCIRITSCNTIPIPFGNIYIAVEADMQLPFLFPHSVGPQYWSSDGYYGPNPTWARL
jgi:hypothetical protein